VRLMPPEMRARMAEMIEEGVGAEPRA
jgi:hypothetical protein